MKTITREPRYNVICRETGDIIEWGLSKSEAFMLLKEFEKLDKKDGIYEENFYKIIEEGAGIKCKN